METKFCYWTVLLATASVSAYSAGCNRDVFVDPPPSLFGDYKGTYSLLKVTGIDTLIDTANFITMRFTDTDFNYAVDEQLVPEDERFFCGLLGGYSLDNGVVFDQVDGNPRQQVCTEDNNPQGLFGLDQSSLGDTVLVMQDSTDQYGTRCTKTLKLVLTE